MASNSPAYGSDPTTPNTTFVQADPANFRAVVQKLTGASDDPATPKLPLTLPARLVATDPIASKKAAFKLHERRHMNAPAKKLELNVAPERPSNMNVMMMMMMSVSSSSSPSSSAASLARSSRSPLMMASPVSPLELLGHGTPKSSEKEEEEKAIAEKGFYLHPSPRSASHSEPPQLLPLFPLHSPSHNTNS